MPLYEYKCSQCGSVIEALQKASDPPLKKCSSCGGSLQKQISSPSIQFKGSGWYITDYARKGADASQPESPKATEGKKTDTPPSKKSAPDKDQASSPAT